MALKIQPGHLLPLAIIGAIAACQPAPPEGDEPGSGANTDAATPVLPVADPPIDRSRLLSAVARAASAATLGQDDLAAQRQLEGRDFEIRIRFGCPDAAGGRAAAALADAPFAIGFDEASRTLRIRARPDLTGQDEWVASLGGPDVEAVEGFWIYRPWLLADGCPVVSDRATPAAAPGPAAQPAGRTAKVGIAHFFTGADSRTGRRDRRAYEATRVLDAEETPSMQGYNLVLAGRLVKPPGGNLVSCRVVDSRSPPDCVVAAQFDRVRIERPDTKAILAEWSS